MDQVAANPNTQIFGEIEGNYTFLGMNCKDGPFTDINLRRAVAWALDRETLVKQAYFGRAQQAYTPISPPMTDFFDPDIATSGRGQWFDLDKAREFRAMAENQDEIEVTYMMAERGPVGTRTAQTIVPMLAQIGIKVNLELVEPATWLKRRNEGSFDLYDFEWVADLDPDEAIYPEFKSDGAWNFCGWVEYRIRRSLCAGAGGSGSGRTAQALLCGRGPSDGRGADRGHGAYADLQGVLEQGGGFQYIPADLMNLHSVSIT